MTQIGVPTNQLVGAGAIAFLAYFLLQSYDMFRAAAIAVFVWGVLIMFLKYMVKRNPYWLEYTQIKHTKYPMKRYAPRW